MLTEKKLYFPNELKIRLLENDINCPIPKIVLLLTVYARSKNDYHLGPQPSDAEGVITVSRDWVKHAIEYQRNTFLMDYVTPMEDCWPSIRIKVMASDEISRAISAMKLYGIEMGDATTARTIPDMENAANSNYRHLELHIELDDPNEVLREVTLKMQRL